MVMKTVLYLFIVVFLISCSTEESRTTDQPEAVQNAFKSQYSDVKKATWEKDGDTYTVEFETDGMETEVTYDKKGNVLAVEEEIPISALPAGALAYIAENHPASEIEEAEKIEKESNVYYSAEIEEDEEELELLFDDEGNYLGLEPDDGDDEE
jgi:hypothetical protein